MCEWELNHEIFAIVNNYTSLYYPFVPIYIIQILTMLYISLCCVASIQIFCQNAHNNKSKICNKDGILKGEFKH